MANNDLDFTLAGKRIKLIFTGDKYTRLQPNDEGTIKYRFWKLDCWCLQIQWQNGSNLSLIEGIDAYEIMD